MPFLSGKIVLGVYGINAFLATVKRMFPRRSSSGSGYGGARAGRRAERLGWFATPSPPTPQRHGLRPSAAPGRFRVLRLRHDERSDPAGAALSVTARIHPAVKRAITAIPDTAWEAIEYTNAIYDEATKAWISTAEVAEIPFTAFTSRKKSEHIIGRLVVRRIPELNKKDLEHPTLFDTHRFHAFFTTSDLPTVAAEKTHRAHAVIDLVNADLKNSALAHLPSGVFTAIAAWLVLAVMAFNLTRAAATIAGAGLDKATTATIRREPVTVPARIASSARRITLHLPEQWPWETAWTALFRHSTERPRPAPS
ncbi:hypothetical protein E3O35_06365 [Cryobacterium sp. MDB2-A-2]|nr:hypothetical protein E3O39_09200 [Cryobacterium sp. MDB2-A-1]TFC12557.1 hypothetical protein E3O35_06365 [Cryobacterium sp. MDB2-A-2]